MCLPSLLWPSSVYKYNTTAIRNLAPRAKALNKAYFAKSPTSPTYQFCMWPSRLFSKKRATMDTKKSGDDDARARAEKYQGVDPFPHIPRALLSSLEILDYAETTGMVYPFDKTQLKSASYEVHIGGEAIWWDGKGKRHKKVVKRGDPLVLEANSIVFVQVEPTFRLPNYIAIRFNLRITHVHRGLLLGTGPLVDPGFHGQLLIPLHNLTSQPYEIDTNDALIWIEFTKTTFGYEPPGATPEAIKERHQQFRGFPRDKRDMKPDQYLWKAARGRAIQSSIPSSIAEAELAAKRAEKSVGQVKQRVTIGAIVATLTIVVAVIGLALQVGSMIQNAHALVASLSTDSKATLDKVNALSLENKTLGDRVGEMKTRNDVLSARVDGLTAEIQKRQAAAPKKNVGRRSGRRASR